MMVIVDDLALPFGTIRVKAKGGAGGHNGITNIIDVLNSQNFNRLRFGIGNAFSKGAQVDYVLGTWTDDENKLLPERIKKIIGSIKNFATIGINRTMNFSNEKYNAHEKLKKLIEEERKDDE